jgi:hypothetical protein
LEEYITGYYCRDKSDLRTLNKEPIRAIIDALKKAYPTPLNAHELENKTGLPIKTVYAQLEDLKREHFVLDYDIKKRTPRGRPKSNGGSEISERHRNSVIVEDASRVFNTLGIAKGKLTLPPGHVEYSDNFLGIWHTMVEKKDIEEINQVLLNFLERVVKRKYELFPTVNKQDKKTDYCCSQCGLNHEARDLVRSLSICMIDEMEASKEYLDFMRRNEFLTEDGYNIALSKTQQEDKSQSKHYIKMIQNFEKDLMEREGITLQDMLNGLRRKISSKLADETESVKKKK